jgi:hypothetical protein
MTKFIFQLFIFTATFTAWAQIGGEGTFVSLNLPYSARHVALGGNAINAMDDDVSIGLHAPSLLNKNSHRRATFSHSYLAGGINYGQFGYAHQIKNNQFISTSFRYASYGKMDLTLPTGELAGDFYAGDLIASAGYGHHVNEVVSVGANLNFAFSTLETYQAFGMTLDFSGTLNFADKNTVVTALIRNAGMQFSGYVNKNRERISPNPMIAISHKLEHAPFRLTLLAQHLNRWDITYVDPNEQPFKDPFTNELIEPKRANFIAKTMHHLVFQVEALFGKNFHLRAAFDYRQREEMRITNRTGMSGFSLGMGLMLKKFQFQYGFNVVSAAGFNNMFTMSTNINEWKK